ncbi:MAG: T9SS type A sorting domain-containing protein [Fibromonadaceae bacterium]|nr:T9SS type A sorting domain-containing protein [Fibromonadaceae bacterium]
MLKSKKDINLQATNNAAVEIFNLKGNLISKQNFGNGAYTVSFGHLPKGIYIVKISFGNEMRTLRVAVR